MANKKPHVPTEAEMADKAVQVHTAYGQGVLGMMESGRILDEYDKLLADSKKFKEFYEKHCHWSKTHVYRLVRTWNCFGTQDAQTLGMFDPSALYRLSENKVDQATRDKAIDMAEEGKFVSNKVVTEELLLKTKSTTSRPKPGTIYVRKQDLAAAVATLSARLTAAGKSLTADDITHLLEDLGVHVQMTRKSTKPAAKKPAKVVKAPAA